MKFRYNLDELPPGRETFLFGLQWLAVTLPGILIIGRVIGLLQFPNYADQVLFLQKTCFLVSVALFAQVLWGHRLPLVIGPATVLLVGMVASRGVPASTIFTSIGAGGLLLALVSFAGLLRPLQRLFTPRVVAAVLLLIAFTLAPTVLRLMVASGTPSALSGFLLSLGLVLVLFVAYRRLAGLWRSTLIVWGLAAGTAIYYLIFGLRPLPSSLPLAGGFFRQLTVNPSFDPGVLVSFFFCFLALAVNDLGSIQSTGELLGTQDLPQRISRGIAFTGVANAVSGFLGVLGPVNFSLSPGVIAATGCASRYTLLPAAGLLFLLSLSPLAIAFVAYLPDVVVGAVLLYILSAQVAAGLQIVFLPGDFEYRHGLILGLPLLLGTIVAFLPPEVLGTFPPFLRPIFGNGFVMGTAAALTLEHLVLAE